MTDGRSPHSGLCWVVDNRGVTSSTAPRLDLPRTITPSAPVFPTTLPSSSSSSAASALTRHALLQLGIDPTTPGMLATPRDVLPGPAPYFAQAAPSVGFDVDGLPSSVAMILTKLSPRLAAALAGGASGVFDANALVGALSSWMLAHHDPQPGLRNGGVVAGLLRSLGLSAEPLQGLPLPQLRSALAIGRQALAIGDAHGTMRAVVVTGHDQRSGLFFINDPRDREQRPRSVAEADLSAFVVALVLVG